MANKNEQKKLTINNKLSEKANEAISKISDIMFFISNQKHDKKMLNQLNSFLKEIEEGYKSSATKKNNEYGDISYNDSYSDSTTAKISMKK